MTATSTSVYADVWRALARLLAGENWPAPPMDSAAGVKVFACSFGQDADGVTQPTAQPPDESVLLITETIEEEQSWGPIGEQRREERFLVQIDVATLLPHPSWLAALDRLEELTAVVERLVHRTARVGEHPAELAGRLVKWQVIRSSPQVVVMSSGKFGGGAVMVVEVTARIKPTSP